MNQSIRSSNGDIIGSQPLPCWSRSFSFLELSFCPGNFLCIPCTVLEISRQLVGINFWNNCIEMLQEEFFLHLITQ